MVVYCIIIFLLSSMPNVPGLPGGISDKAGHAMLYGGLGFLVARAVAGTGSRWWPLLVVVFAALYGLSDEVHQLFVPGRQFELADLAADAAGAAIGAALYRLWVIISRTTWARSR